MTDPEQKRKIIGQHFIDVFKDEARGLGDVKFLAQGTLYPDVIESRSAHGGPSATIKSHHNVGGLPDELGFELIEPLRELFKDEVRVLGHELGLPDRVVGRQPFPGPGLAVRVLGEITRERLDVLREADVRVQEELVHDDDEGQICHVLRRAAARAQRRRDGRRAHLRQRDRPARRQHAATT